MAKKEKEKKEVVKKDDLVCKCGSPKQQMQDKVKCLICDK